MNERQWDITYRDKTNRDAFCYVGDQDPDEILRWLADVDAEPGVDVTVRLDGEFIQLEHYRPYYYPVIEQVDNKGAQHEWKLDRTKLYGLPRRDASPAVERERIRARAEKTLWPSASNE